MRVNPDTLAVKNYTRFNGELIAGIATGAAGNPFGYDGIWNEQGRSIQLIVLPPPWKTWWAYTIYAATCKKLIPMDIAKVQREYEPVLPNRGYNCRRC